MVILLVAVTVAALVTIDARRARRASRAPEQLNPNQSSSRGELPRCA